MQGVLSPPEQVSAHTLTPMVEITPVQPPQADAGDALTGITVFALLSAEAIRSAAKHWQRDGKDIAVPVTSDQLATLRSYLSGDFSDYEQSAQPDRPVPQPGGLRALGVSRRVLRGGRAEVRGAGSSRRKRGVIEFVADVRAQFDRDGNQIDPRAAERMIRAVYTDGAGSMTWTARRRAARRSSCSLP